MAADIEQQRRQAHDFLDRLPAAQIPAVRGLLEAMLDPFERTLATAEIDDEPVSEAERREIAAARQWFEHNEGIPFEQVAAECGLTMEEIRNYRDPETNGKDGH